MKNQPDFGHDCEGHDTGLPRPGTLVISLDFELYWGMRDKVDLDASKANLRRTRGAIPRLLDIFARSGVHVTWATVGFLFFDDKDELLAHLPARRPRYLDKHLSPYDHVLRIGPNERKDPYHYGRSLIRHILDYPNQEIGTHTFSHYYCLEEGQTIQEFRADLDAAHAAARRLGVELKSLVFPRNQWRPDYLAACADTGIGAVRGNEQPWTYRRGLANRALRLADCYVNVCGHHGQKASHCDAGVINVPASQFLRPVSRSLVQLDPLRLRRIRTSMDYAARNGLVYHLWWHPHNFGAHPDENLEFLSGILGHFRTLADEHRMVSRSMGELIPGAGVAPIPPPAQVASANAEGGAFVQLV